MPARLRPRLEPTDDWQQLQLLSQFPEQLTYELIRPVVLFGHSPAERAQQTGADTSRALPLIPPSAMGIQPLAIERCAELAEPFRAQLAPIRELVASLPAPRCDHRQHEDPALAQQVLIDSRIVLADFFGRMGEVEFDGPTAARLEV